MKEQIAEIPAKDATDMAEMVRNWSNHKTFQIAMHTIRGGLVPIEAGVALANVAEASIDAVLQAVVEEAAARNSLPTAGGIAAVILGDLASREVAPHTHPHILFVYEGGSATDYSTLCCRFRKAIGILTETSLLFGTSVKGLPNTLYALDDFVSHYQQHHSELLDLTRARWIFTHGSRDIGRRFDRARHRLLAQGPGREELVQELHNGIRDQTDPEPTLMTCIQRGLTGVERAARLLQLTHLTEMPGSLVTGDATSIFQAGKALAIISEELAAQLVGATSMWRTLHGMRQLIVEETTSEESLSESVKQALAQACDQEDFTQLIQTAHETVMTTENQLTTTLLPSIERGSPPWWTTRSQ